MNKKMKKCVRSEEKTLRKASSWVSKNWVYIISMVALMVVLCVGFAFAADGNNAEDMWKTIVDLIGKWVKRLGAVVLFVGGVMFGLGWKREDADGKSQGISTMIAGAIVIAVSALTSYFA